MQDIWQVAAITVGRRLRVGRGVDLKVTAANLAAVQEYKRLLGFWQHDDEESKKAVWAAWAVVEANS